MSWDKERIAQIQLPDPADDDPHPRLLLEGRGIHAGEGFTALFPDGWHEITLEVAWEPEKDLQLCFPMAGTRLPLK